METKLYTYADVKKHNDSKSAWIVIHNVVYDVTQWLYKHPGGDEVLLDTAGRDASDCFDNIGHSEEAKELRAKYKVGEIVESERRKPTQREPETTSHTYQEESSTPTWLLPVSLGLIATIIYYLYF